MKVLSFDVGIKNLSYCVLEKDVGTDEIRIISWENLCICESNCKKIAFENLCELLILKLQESFDGDFNADVVLIENQPMHKNGLMKSVSVMIYTYFNILKLQFGNVTEVRFISATNKLKCKRVKEVGGNTAKTYKERKLLGIELARRYIEAMCPERMSWFESQKKKDDLSEAALAGIYFLENK